MRAYDDRYEVRTKTATVIGMEKAGILSFKGIPYAKPPVGRLRWHLAEPLGESDEKVFALGFGKSSIQPYWHSEEASFNRQGEDCLTLNIWTAETKPKEKRAVMVWIHGGALIEGGSADPLYNGHNFVKRRNDIVFVSINYRLGVLGFMDLSRFGKEYEYSANLGIYDQITALKWIKENIAYFGGDPDNITVFGESAGSASIAYMMVMEDAKGLFHKAIIQSTGGSAYQMAQKKGGKECNDVTDKLLETAKAGTIEELMALSEEKLMEITDEMILQDIFNPPSCAGAGVPEDVWQAFEENRASSGIPVIVGFNADEDRYDVIEFKGYENYCKIIKEDFDNLKSEMNEEQLAGVREYFRRRSGMSEVDIISSFNTDCGYMLGEMTFADYHSKFAPTYVYHWEIPSALENVGACHAIELAYVMQNLQEDIFTGEVIEKDIAGKVQDLWANFAITGVPDTEYIKWPEYNCKDITAMIFSKEGFYTKNNFKREDREALKPFFCKYYNEADK